MEINLISDAFFHEMVKQQVLVPIKPNEINNTIHITLQGIKDYDILKKDSTKFKKLILYYKNLKHLTRSEQLVKHLILHILKNVHEKNMTPSYEKIVKNLKKNVQGLTIYNFVLKISKIKAELYRYDSYMNKIQTSFEKNLKKVAKLSEDKIKKHSVYREYFLLPHFRNHLQKIKKQLK